VAICAILGILFAVYIIINSNIPTKVSDDANLKIEWYDSKIITTYTLKNDKIYMEDRMGTDLTKLTHKRFISLLGLCIDYLKNSSNSEAKGCDIPEANITIKNNGKTSHITQQLKFDDNVSKTITTIYKYVDKNKKSK
jgi:hypothetical protein